MNRRFQAELAKSKNVHILKTTDKDHQMPFVGGPHTRITNPRWRTAAILEKFKNSHISAAVGPILIKCGVMMQFVPVDRRDLQKLEIFKIQDGGGLHLEKSKNRHISAAVQTILTEFGMV